MAKQFTREELIKEFWSYVDKSSSCWTWRLAKSKGYGVFTYGKRLAGSRFAHRVAFVLAKGPIPPAMVIDHICRVRSCVNPDHLRLVTNAVNILVGVSPCAINARKTHCVKGHPFDEVNTYRSPKGYRVCRPCRSEAKRQSALASRHGTRLRAEIAAAQRRAEQAEAMVRELQRLVCRGVDGWTSDDLAQAEAIRDECELREALRPTPAREDETR